MADTKQYIIGTSDQAGKLKHKDYTEWVDSITGTVVKAPGTSSTDKANGTIISLASNLDELENTRIYDAIDIEWAPYKIKHYNNGSTVEEPLRTTSDVIDNINNLYTYSTTSSYNFSNAYNNLKSYVLTTYNNVKTSYDNLNSYVLKTYNNTKTAHNNLNSYVLTTYNNVKTSYDNLYTYVLSSNNNINSNVLTLYNDLNSYVLTTYNNVKTAYDSLYSYVLTTYNNVKISYDNLKSYVLTTYNNVKTSYDNLKAYVLTTYNNINTSYNNLYTYVLTSYDNLKAYVLTTYNNVRTSYNNLNSYVLTTYNNVKTSYNNVKTSYDNLKAYVLTTYNNVKTSYDNLYTYVLTLSNNSSSSNNDIKTAYNNLYSYVLTTYNNVKTSYNNLYSYTTSKCASIESKINNLDVNNGKYEDEIELPIVVGSSANENNTTHVITGITQTNGKISYTYSGLFITPTLINDSNSSYGKFITGITKEDDNTFDIVRGNINVIPITNYDGNAVTDIVVDSNGDIRYGKVLTFATKTELDGHYSNLNSYILTSYNNVKTSYDNLKSYVLTTYNNVKTSYDNLYKYVVTLSNNSSYSSDDIRTSYNNLYSYVLTTYNNVRTSYNNLYTYTTSKCANIESKINNLDVSAGNYKSTLALGMMPSSEANKNNTISVITGITQTDGKISYSYSGLYVTPTLINTKGDGKFITKIDSIYDDGVFNAYRGNIDIKPGTSTTGNAITGLSVNADGDIVYEKGTTFVTNTQLNNLDVNKGNYEDEIKLPEVDLPSANENNTIHVITGITQTDGKISYSYSGLFITPSLPITVGIDDKRVGKFITNIEVVGDHLLYASRGTISAGLDPKSNNIGNAITNLGVTGVGDILYEKTIVFADVNSKNTFTDDQTATAWYVSSDINYKEIIDDCKITIDEISKLPIFDYIWKLDEEKKLHTGSSAQAVEEILPNLVTEDNEGIKSLDYASLGAIAGILACREICKLRDKIDKLDKIIENKL